MARAGGSHAYRLQLHRLNSVAPGAKASSLVTEDGTISGLNRAREVPTRSTENRTGRAIYKGCAIAANGQRARLYATTFSPAMVEIFDEKFNRDQPQ